MKALSDIVCEERAGAKGLPPGAILCSSGPCAPARSDPRSRQGRAHLRVVNGLPVVPRSELRVILDQVSLCNLVLRHAVEARTVMPATEWAALQRGVTRDPKIGQGNPILRPLPQGD